MKTLITIFILAQLYACSTLKRSSSKTSQSDQQDRLQSWSYSFERDSSSANWHFTTDSPFYYHPKLGLWAWSGQMWQQSFSQQSSLTVDQTDSTSRTQMINKEKDRERTISRDHWLLLLILVGLLGVLKIIRDKWSVTRRE